MRTATAITIVLAFTALAGCSPPKPPDEERRPQPQAQTQAPPTSAIVQSANAYQDRARNAEAESLGAADRQRQEIDAATQ